MLEYELLNLLHIVTPFLGGALCVLMGIFISNLFWKSRIHRYAKTEVVETLEFQKNKIIKLTEDVRNRNELIGELRGSIKVIKLSALNIISSIK